MSLLLWHNGGAPGTRLCKHVRRKSEWKSTFFSEWDELLRSLNEGIKIDNNVNKVKLFTKKKKKKKKKIGIKWCKKGYNFLAWDH